MGYLSGEYTRKEFVDYLSENNWNRPGDRAFFRKFYDYVKDFGDRDDPMEVDTMWAPNILFAYKGDKPEDRDAVAAFIREMMNNPAYDVPEDLSVK